MANNYRGERAPFPQYIALRKDLFSLCSIKNQKFQLQKWESFFQYRPQTQAEILWLDVTTMAILYNFSKEFTSLCDTFEFCMWWVQLSGLVSEGCVFSHGGEAGKLLCMCRLMFWQQFCSQGLSPSGIFLDKPSTESVVCLIMEVWLLIVAPSFYQMLMWIMMLLVEKKSVVSNSTVNFWCIIRHLLSVKPEDGTALHFCDVFTCSSFQFVVVCTVSWLHVRPYLTCEKTTLRNHRLSHHISKFLSSTSKWFAMLTCVRAN